MFPSFEHPTVRLCRRRVAAHRRCMDGVTRGRVWVTMSGDDVDHFIERGRVLRLPRPWRAIVGAEEDADLVLVRTAQGPSPLQRLLSWFRRGRAGTQQPPAPA